MRGAEVSDVNAEPDVPATIVRANRAEFDRAGVTVVALTGAPGAGKTCLIERALAALDDVRAAVVASDAEGRLDADRLASCGVPVVQVNTAAAGASGVSHLDAGAVRAVLPALPLDALDLLVVEAVGGLAGPAGCGVGEDVRVAVSSVAAGEDEPAKYPQAFGDCELVLINKVDLLEHLDFDLDHFLARLDGVAPHVERMVVSARTGEGIDAWCEWLRARSGVALAELPRD